VISGGAKAVNEIQALMEQIQELSGSSTVDLRYRPEEESPHWAVVIDWGRKYTAVVPSSLQEDPIISLKSALNYLVQQKGETSQVKGFS
jgi:hypothetical protein